MRRRAVTAGIGSLVASIALAGTLVMSEGSLKTSREEIRIQARDGVVLVQKGDQVRIERGAADPVVFAAPRLTDLGQREQFRVAADTAVVWLFFFAAWSAVYLAAMSQQQALDLQKRACCRRKRGPAGAGPGASLPGQSALPVQYAEQPVEPGDDRAFRPKRRK